MHDPFLGDTPRPGSPDGDWLLAARQALAAGDLAAAERYAEARLRAAPGDSDALNLRGSVSMLRDDRPAARSAFEAALSANPAHAKARYNLALIALEDRELGSALEHLEGSFAGGEGSADDRVLAGNVAHALGRMDSASRHWREALRLDAGSEAACTNLSRALRSAGRVTEALELLNHCHAAHPGSALTWNESGIALCDLARWEDAGAHFAHARAMDATGSADIVSNLAETLRHLGRPQEARTLLENAVAECAEPGRVLKALGLLHLSEGRRDDAARLYRQAREHLPDDEEVAHLLAAAEGTSRDTAPDSYVRTLFDQYAASFDRDLQQDLCYRTPGHVADVLRPHLQPMGRLRVLDLGCGTGLSGVAVRPWAATLEGVDLSPQMLARAKATGAYTGLVCEGVLPYLARQPGESVDLVVACDVFIYVGRLDPVFDAVARVLAPGGWFVLSVETEPADGGEDRACVLRPSGRFAHSPRHVISLGTDRGFVLAHRADLPLRLDRGGMLPGTVLLMRRG